MKFDKPIMTTGDALALYDLFRSHGITVWVDGGSGVDALLGRQTRPHSDLDIALRHSDVPKLRTLLEECGYRDVPRDNTRDCNFVLGDDLGHQIDVHSFELDAQGNNVFGCEYRAEHLSGEGTISGRVVKCIPPKQIIEFHTGYKIDDDDAADVKALCEKFGIEMPEDHKAYWKVGQVCPFINQDFAQQPRNYLWHDRALIAMMVYSFARIGAVIQMKVGDYFVQGRRRWVRLHEKGGKEHDVPCHHRLDQCLHDYIEAAGIETRIGNHTFRATGITAYLKNSGKLEVAQQIANHESPRTTKLYDRRQDEISLDEIERITI